MILRAQRAYKCFVCGRKIRKGSKYRCKVSGRRVIRLCNFGCVYVPVRGGKAGYFRRTILTKLSAGIAYPQWLDCQSAAPGCVRPT